MRWMWRRWRAHYDIDRIFGWSRRMAFWRAFYGMWGFSTYLHPPAVRARHKTQGLNRVGGLS